jgi:hypothetical protein
LAALSGTSTELSIGGVEMSVFGLEAKLPQPAKSAKALRHRAPVKDFMGVSGVMMGLAPIISHKLTA